MPLDTELVYTISYIKPRTQEFQNRMRSISRRLISLILSLSDITVTVVVTRVVDGVCMSFTDHFVLGWVYLFLGSPSVYPFLLFLLVRLIYKKLNDICAKTRRLQIRSYFHTRALAIPST